MAAFDAALGSSATSSTSVTTSAAAASNSKIIICVEWFHATATLSSVSGGSLTWTIDKQLLAGSVGVAIVSADAASGLASSTALTLTYSTAPTAGDISVFSFTGVQTGAGSVDTTSTFNGGLLGTPAAYNSGNLVTTASDVLVCCAGYDKATGVSNTPTSPAVEVHELHNSTSGESLASEYRIETAPATYTVAGQMPGATGTGQLNAVGVAYKAVADVGSVAQARPLLPTLTMFQPLWFPNLGFPRLPGPTVGGSILVTLTANDVVSSATLTKQVGKLQSTTSTTTASLVKQVGKILSVTVTTLASLAAAKTKALTLSATVTTTASLIKQVNKPLTKTVTTTGTLVKQVGKILSATVTATATLTTVKVKLLTLTATVTTTASLLKQVGKPLLVTVTGTPTLLKQVNKTLTQTVTTTASILAQKVKLLTLTATVTTTATLAKRVNKLLSVTSSITASLVAVSSAIVVFLSKQFDATIGRGRSGDSPHDAEWQSGPHGNMDSDPHDKSFD